MQASPIPVPLIRPALACRHTLTVIRPEAESGHSRLALSPTGAQMSLRIRKPDCPPDTPTTVPAHRSECLRTRLRPAGPEPDFPVGYFRGPARRVPSASFRAPDHDVPASGVSLRAIRLHRLLLQLVPRLPALPAAGDCARCRGAV